MVSRLFHKLSHPVAEFNLTSFFIYQVFYSLFVCFWISFFLNLLRLIYFFSRIQCRLVGSWCFDVRNVSGTVTIWCGRRRRKSRSKHRGLPLSRFVSNSGLFRLAVTRDVSARDYGKEEGALRTVRPAWLVTREVTGDKSGFASLCWLCHVGILVLCGGLGLKLMLIPTSLHCKRRLEFYGIPTSKCFSKSFVLIRFKPTMSPIHYPILQPRTMPLDPVTTSDCIYLFYPYACKIIPKRVLNLPITGLTRNSVQNKLRLCRLCNRSFQCSKPWLRHWCS